MGLSLRWGPGATSVTTRVPWKATSVPGCMPPPAHAPSNPGVTPPTFMPPGRLIFKHATCPTETPTGRGSWWKSTQRPGFWAWLFLGGTSSVLPPGVTGWLLEAVRATWQLHSVPSRGQKLLHGSRSPTLTSTVFPRRLHHIMAQTCSWG